MKLGILLAMMLCASAAQAELSRDNLDENASHLDCRAAGGRKAGSRLCSDWP
jgi:hypothetical protein